MLKLLIVSCMLRCLRLWRMVRVFLVWFMMKFLVIFSCSCDGFSLDCFSSCLRCLISCGWLSWVLVRLIDSGLNGVCSFCYLFICW